MSGLTAAAFVATWLLVLAVGWIAYHLIRQNGRLFLRIDELEHDLNDFRAQTIIPPRPDRSLAGSRINRDGLTPGTPAPDFTLPTVEDGTLTLRQYRGRRVLLVFSDPDCVPCSALAPRLQALSETIDDVQIVMVSRGDLAANRKKVDELGLGFPIALQKHWEISRAYGKFVTPMAYLINEHGVIAAPVAAGADPILTLLSNAAAQPVAAATGVTHG